MDILLRTFNGDVHSKEALKAYMLDYINRSALEMMYTKKDVSHITDAVSLLNGAFEQLDIDYGIKQPTIQKTDQSR